MEENQGKDVVKQDRDTPSVTDGPTRVLASTALHLPYRSRAPVWVSTGIFCSGSCLVLDIRPSPATGLDLATKLDSQGQSSALAPPRRLDPSTILTLNTSVLPAYTLVLPCSIRPAKMSRPPGRPPCIRKGLEAIFASTVLKVCSISRH